MLCSFQAQIYVTPFLISLLIQIDDFDNKLLNASNWPLCSLREITLLRATRGECNPNLEVVITHASHVCSQHSFVLPLRMNGMHRTQFDHAFWPFTPRNLIMRVLTICHLKPMQSTVLELKRFEFWPLSALRNPLGFLSTVGHVNNFL